jgi:hypothetical protein
MAKFITQHSKAQEGAHSTQAGSRNKIAERLAWFTAPAPPPYYAPGVRSAGARLPIVLDIDKNRVIPHFQGTDTKGDAVRFFGAGANYAHSNRAERHRNRLNQRALVVVQNRIGSLLPAVANYRGEFFGAAGSGSLNPHPLGTRFLPSFKQDHQLGWQGAYGARPQKCHPRRSFSQTPG